VTAGRKWVTRRGAVIWNPRTAAEWSMTTDAGTWDQLEEKMAYQDSIS